MEIIEILTNGNETYIKEKAEDIIKDKTAFKFGKNYYNINQFENVLACANCDLKVDLGSRACLKDCANIAGRRGYFKKRELFEIMFKNAGDDSHEENKTK